ncbi:dipeptidase [Desulfoscipio gibsoniae]
MNIPWIVDGHCDTLTAIAKQNRTFGERSAKGQLDLPRMQSGGINVQFFAAFIAPKYKDTALKKCLQLIDIFYTQILKDRNSVEPALNGDDIHRVAEAGKIAALLSIEGGEALTGDIAVLRTFYRLGVRSLTLTWNGRNELGDGVGEGSAAGGLSSFGRLVVQTMNDLGMLIDVAHLAARGFWDVAEISSRPFAATHANCRAVCDHPRNLDDHQIEFLARNGGIVGLTFVPEFIDRHDPCIEAFISHVDHIASRFGTDCIGLGSDFDGMDKVTPGLHDATCGLRLAEELIKHGYSYEQVSGIMGGNWLRLLAKVLQ